MSSQSNSNLDVPRPSSRPSRPCASRYFTCDTDSFPDSVPIQVPKRIPDKCSFNLQTVPRPIAGLNTHKPLSSSADVALLGEPSFILSPVATCKYLPSIGDLLPAKQQAPVNTSGKFYFQANKMFYRELSSIGN